MSHMKKLLFLIFVYCTLNLSKAYSQIPGYQGKRFFVELGSSFFINTSFPTIENKGPRTFPSGRNTGDISLRSRYAISLNYVISRKHTFKVAYNYHFSGLYTTNYASGRLNHLFYQSYMHDINLGFNLYGRTLANLAPLGFYWDLGARFIFVNNFLSQQMVNDVLYDAESGFINSPALNPLTAVFGIGIQWGYRAIIANRITLNVGLETTICPQYLMLIDSLLNPFREIEIDSHARDVIRSVQDRYIFNVHIGIGILI